MQIDREWLETAACRLRRRHDLAVGAVGLAVGLAVTGIALRAGTTIGSASGIAAAVAVFLVIVLIPRRHKLTALALARHLDRMSPATEESAELLLAEPGSLPRLARLQQRRVQEALAAGDPPALPVGPFRGLLRVAAATGLMAAILLALPTVQAAPHIAGDAPLEAAASAPSGAAAAIRLEAVTIAPPAYTGLSHSRQESWDLEAVEGAIVTWQFTTSGPVEGGRLVTAAGDTVSLSGADGRFRVTMSAVRSTLYRIHLESAGGEALATDDHRLMVLPDAPPLLTVVQPDARTMIQPGGSLRVPVEVLARDDHGVDSVVIIATVSKGQGEGVKFREQRLGFTTRERREERGLLLRRELDLAALGLEPGDELYFHAIATDRRSPVPNEGRSETIFVTLVDSTRAITTGPGAVALDITPDYFRSQRQLIIDTEKLLTDQPRLARAVFMGRANGLGIDQGLLRLRYGQFMGDEFEGEMPASGREAHAAHDHDHDRQVTAVPEPPVAGQVTIPGQTGPDLMEELTHQHDDPENATLLAPQVKARLRDAINAMWSAELHLRLGEPRRSLPFQHRALELLQEIRQDARAYVQRVGFAPPPLEPDLKRLTGDLSEIRAPALDRQQQWQDPAPVLRDGLARLERLAGNGPLVADDLTRLEALGQAMAQRAIEDAPWLLEPLGALRDAVSSLQADARRCVECLRVAERGVLRAIQRAPPGALAERRTGSGAVARYRELLQMRR